MKKKLATADESVSQNIPRIKVFKTLPVRPSYPSGLHTLALLNLHAKYAYISCKELLLLAGIHAFGKMYLLRCAYK
jgi:hypothetical protein